MFVDGIPALVGLAGKRYAAIVLMTIRSMDQFNHSRVHVNEKLLWKLSVTSQPVSFQENMSKIQTFVGAFK